MPVAAPLPDYSNLVWRPLITYTNCGASTTLELTLPQRIWQPYGEAAVGGGDVSAAGIPEQRVYRHDRGRVVTLRFFEEEWPGVDLWLKTVLEQGQFFTFQFDANDVATAYTVRLVSPQVLEAYRPQWVENIVFELDVEIATSDGSQIDLPYNPRA